MVMGSLLEKHLSLPPWACFLDFICDSARVGQEANDLLNWAFHRVNGVFCLCRREEICFEGGVIF